jgi:hypothetical protein
MSRPCASFRCRRRVRVRCLWRGRSIRRSDPSTGSAGSKVGSTAICSVVLANVLLRRNGKDLCADRGEPHRRGVGRLSRSPADARVRRAPPAIHGESRSRRHCSMPDGVYTPRIFWTTTDSMTIPQLL